MDASVLIGAPLVLVMIDCKENSGRLVVGSGI